MRVQQATAGLRRCEQLDAQYHQALKAGGNAATIGRWIAANDLERQQHTATLQQAHPPSRTLTAEQVRGLLAPLLATLPEVLASAEPARQEALYGSLGLQLTYYPNLREVTVEADPIGQPCGKRGAGGGTRTLTPLRARRF